MIKLMALNLLLAALAACGGHGPSLHNTNQATSQTAASTPIWLPAFTATQPNAKADCQTAVDVELSVVNEALSGALLTDVPQGDCETSAASNKRFYELSLVGVDCGSRVYAGELGSTKGGGWLQVTDHSTRTCADRKPALIELEEIASGKRRELAGDWQ